MSFLIIVLSFCCNYVWTVKEIDEAEKVTFTCVCIVLLIAISILLSVFGGAPDEV